MILFDKLVCYESLDTLPMWNWYLLNKEKDLSQLIAGDDKTITKRRAKRLNALVRTLNEDYVDRFGFDDELLKRLRIEKRIAKLQSKYILTGDRSIITFIKIEENALAELQSDPQEENIYKTKTYVEKILGVPLDLTKISVAEFHVKCELASELAKQQMAA